MFKHHFFGVQCDSLLFEGQRSFVWIEDILAGLHNIKALIKG